MLKDHPEFAELDSHLHVLWTKAVGTPGYDKEEWRQMEQKILNAYYKYLNVLELLERER